MRWKKLPTRDRGLHDELKTLGCTYPGNTSWYSYHVSTAGAIQRQPCVRLHHSLRTGAAKKYVAVQHYTVETSCEYAQKVLCVRTPRDVHDHVIVTMHEVGKCPLCKYHTAEEYTTQMREESRRI